MNGNDDDGNSLPKNCNKYDYEVVVWLLNYFMSFLPLPLDARGEGGWGFSEAVRWGARDRSGFVFGPVFVYGSCIITLCNISCVHKIQVHIYTDLIGPNRVQLLSLIDISIGRQRRFSLLPAPNGRYSASYWMYVYFASAFFVVVVIVVGCHYSNCMASTL